MLTVASFKTELQMFSKRVSCDILDRILNSGGKKKTKTKIMNQTHA